MILPKAPLVCCLPAILMIAPALVQAQPSAIWQIGRFDESSYEFRQGLPEPDAVFVVGKSDPRQWPADQPGTSNGKAGFRPHPVTIRFELPDAPRGLYTLKLALLAFSPRLPLLEVNVNGRRGRFYQRPFLNYGAGHIANQFLPHYATSAITAGLPTPFLLKGTNTLVLTAIDEPCMRDDYEGTGGSQGSSQITYDALALEHDPSKAYSDTPLAAEVVPTIFYKAAPSGLVEIVDVTVRGDEPLGGGAVTLALGPHRLTGRFSGDTEFGEQRLRFDVPEFASTAIAKVTVSRNGKPQEFRAEVKPAKKWNLFVVPHQHMDIGYTDYPPKVAEVQSRAIDQAMEMIRANPDFRYTLDSCWVAEQFLAGRSEAQREKFLNLIREKKILVPAQYAGNYTGVPTVEHLVRSFYHSHKLLRQSGGDFDHAILTDIPTHSWSYPSIMAAASLKYLVLPANNNLGPILFTGRQHEKSPFWWEGPDGGRVLTWYSRHYSQVMTMFGLPPKVESGHDSLPTFLQIYTRPEYKSDGVLVFGTQLENTDLYREQSAMVRDWNSVYAYPRLRFSGVAEALAYIAGQIGDSIPVVRGDGGAFWDIGRVEQPYFGALSRETNHRVLAAEKFSTAASVITPHIRPDGLALEQAWKGLFAYDEHTNSGGRDATFRNRHGKPALSANNARLVEQVLMRSLSALADSIQVPSGTLVVFNPLNWQRSKLVEVEIATGQQLVDPATNEQVVVEELWSPGPAAASRRIRFLAADVPALGYRCYTVREAPQAAPPLENVGGHTIENRYYRVVLDPATGAVQSIFDKELNREMVDAASPYRFNQFVHAVGEQDRRNRRALSAAVASPPELDIQVAGSGRLVSVVRTSFGRVARMEASSPHARSLTTEIMLYDGEKRIDIVNRVRKTAAPTDEWGYFAFPFAMDRPEFRYETQTGVVNPARDVLPGGAREWSAVQHWVAADEGDVTAAIVPVDAVFVTFGDVIRWRWPKEFRERKATIFSHVFRGHREGDREFTFRYVFTSGRKLAPGVLARLGWDAMSPFEVNEIIAQDKVGNPARPLPPVQGSFAEMDHPGVVLLTWKQAEDGQGTIMRFVEANGQPGTVAVSVPILDVERGWVCNTVEENRSPLRVTQHGFRIDIKPWEIVTVRLEGASRRHAAE